MVAVMVVMVVLLLSSLSLLVVLLLLGFFVGGEAGGDAGVGVNAVAAVAIVFLEQLIMIFRKL